MFEFFGIAFICNHRGGKPTSKSCFSHKVILFLCQKDLSECLIKMLEEVLWVKSAKPLHAVLRDTIPRKRYNFHLKLLVMVYVHNLEGKLKDKARKFWNKMNSHIF